MTSFYSLECDAAERPLCDPEFGECHSGLDNLSQAELSRIFEIMHQESHLVFQVCELRRN